MGYFSRRPVKIEMGFLNNDVLKKINKIFNFFVKKKKKRLLLYSGTIGPYRIAFDSSTSEFWLVFDYAIDFIFFFDVIISFLVSYIDEEEKIVIDKSVKK